MDECLDVGRPLPGRRRPWSCSTRRPAASAAPPRSRRASAGSRSTWTRAEGCIRSVDHAYTADGGLAVLRGNIALDGAIVKTAGVDEAMWTSPAPRSSSSRRTRPSTDPGQESQGRRRGRDPLRGPARAAPACRRCCTRRRSSRAGGWARPAPSSPTGGSPAARRGCRSGTSRPRPRAAASSRSSRTATDRDRHPQPGWTWTSRRRAGHAPRAPGRRRLRPRDPHRPVSPACAPTRPWRRRPTGAVRDVGQAGLNQASVSTSTAADRAWFRGPARRMWFRGSARRCGSAGPQDGSWFRRGLARRDVVPAGPSRRDVVSRAPLRDGASRCGVRQGRLRRPLRGSNKFDP